MTKTHPRGSVRALIEKHGLTPTAVATRAGVPPRTVFRILAGGGISFRNAVRLVSSGQGVTYDGLAAEIGDDRQLVA